MQKLIVVLVLLISQIIFSQGWTPKVTGTSNDIQDLHFLNDNTGYVVGQTGTILKTTNGGDNWITQTSGTASTLNSVRFFDLLTGYAAGTSGVIIKTTNGGSTWVTQTSGTTQHLFGMSLTNVSTVFITKNFTSLSSFLKTDNGGANWLAVYTGSSSATNDIFFINSSTGYMTGLDVGLTKTVNGGVNWTTQSVPGFMVTVFFPSVSTGYVTGSFSGTVGYRTTNEGVNWSTISFPTAGIFRAIYFTSETTGYVGGQLGAGTTPLLMKTTNMGVNWVVQSTGVTQFLNAIQFTNSSTGYACGRVGVVIKTTSGGTTGINNLSEIADVYSLSQNYPNPFNPETQIKFSIPKPGFVKILVYDVNGKLVSSLFEDELNPGVYEIKYNFAGFSTGVYFYRMETAEFNDSKKMLLIK